MGGEKKPQRTATPAVKGSPPRGRGKASLVEMQKNAAGITPAWAGKSRGLQDGVFPWGDHPRVGGEKVALADAMIDSWGSPPRGRGKVVKTDSLKIPARITPAWAGKSWLPESQSQPSRDHPRVGGEKTATSPAAAASPGSPPRGRGKD